MALTLDNYFVMTPAQRKSILKDDGPHCYPPTHFIKDTIEKSIDEKIPLDFAQISVDMKTVCMSEIQSVRDELEKANGDISTLKKVINEQQKFMESSKRDLIKNNVFISGIPNHLEKDDGTCIEE